MSILSLIDEVIESFELKPNNKASETPNHVANAEPVLLLSNTSHNDEEEEMSDDDHFPLILSAVIDTINAQNSRSKIDKQRIITHLQSHNCVDILALKYTIDAISQQPQNATIYKYIKKYYQFTHSLLSHLENIVPTQIDKPSIIRYLLSNHINDAAFSRKKKHIFIKELVDNCNVHKSHAKRLYEKIKAEQTSKFILETSGRNQSVYSVGVQFWYSKWREGFGNNRNNRNNINIESYFDNFKDEITDPNGEILLSIDIWNDEMPNAINNQNKEQCKKYCITTRNAIPFKIPSNTLISIEHLIAVQLYCNNRVAQRRFSATYRITRANESNGENIVLEHRYYANWGRLLYEAVNVFGNRQWDNKYFYHGIDKEMLFTKTIFVHIYCPLSTTSDKNIAISKFGGDNGMVIKIDGSMNNCFDCNFVSDYPDEKEFLFIGSIKPFKIDNVLLYRNSWISLEKYMKAINNIIISITDNDNEIQQIKYKLLTLKNKINGLSFEELCNNLDQFTYEIVTEEDKENQYQLSAVAYIVKLYHCYLSQLQ